MRKQKTFDYWSSASSFMGAIGEAFDLSSARIKWIKLKDGNWRVRVIAHYK